MALQKQLLSFPLSKGINSKSDSKQQQPNELVVLENARFKELLKVRKRPGHDGLSNSIIGSTSTISTSRGCGAFNDELLQVSGKKLYSYSEALDSWSDRGVFVSAKLTSQPIVRNNYQQTVPDSCYHAATGLQMFVWEDSQGGSRYSIIDSATGQQIVSNSLISANAQKPKCFALGSYLFITFYDSSGTHFKYSYVPAVTPAASLTVGDIATDNANTVYDAQIVGSRLFFSYNNATGGINTRYINTALSVSAAKTIAATVATCFSMAGDTSNHVWLSFWESTNVKCIVYDYDLANAVVTIKTIETIANVYNITSAVVGTTCYFFYDITSGTSYNYRIRTNTLTYAGTVGTASNLIRSLSLASKAFVQDSEVYVIGNYSSTYQPSYFLVHYTGHVDAKFSHMEASGVAAKAVLPNVNSIGTSIWQTAYLRKDSSSAQNGVIVSQSGVESISLDFTQPNFVSTEIGNSLLLGSSQLMMYDGANLVEHGFHLYPEQVSLASSAGGSIANGTYQYIVCFEWTDNYGQVHRSAPSIAQSITTAGANGTVTVTIPTLRVTSKSNVICQVYRTAASGTVFYRVSSLTSPTVNSTSADTVTFTDTSADASIIGNNQLYTTGEVENISAPASTIFTSFKNRVILVPSDNPNQWWASKQVVAGTPVEFTDFFVSSMDQYGGEIKAVGPLDDKIIFFKENCKFYVYGNGPAASGLSNDYSNPERIQGDSGCVNQRSVVATPVGLMYQSKKGIYLLDRSLQDQYLGMPAEQVLDGNNVLSAVLLADANQVRFVLDSGTTIVWDYLANAWLTDTGINAIQSCLWKRSSYAVVRATGKALVENADVFTDDGQFVKMRIRTGWLSFAGLQGLQRIWKMFILGSYYSAHKLYVTIAYNFNPYATQEAIIDNTGVNNTNWGSSSTWGSDDFWGSDWPNYRFRVQLNQQKNTAIQVTIEDSQTSDFGEGFDLSNIAFEVGVKVGGNKLESGDSV